MEELINSYLKYVISTGRIVFPVMIGTSLFINGLRFIIRMCGSPSFFDLQEKPRPKVSLKKETPEIDPCKLPESNTDFIQLN